MRTPKPGAPSRFDAENKAAAAPTPAGTTRLPWQAPAPAQHAAQSSHSPSSAEQMSTQAQRRATSPMAASTRATGGPALPRHVVDRFSEAYSHDLSDVGAQTESKAARDMGARAFTVGRQVAFAPGEYRPGTAHGDRLIGHELAHVVQQAGGAGAVQAAGLGKNAHEREADQAADTALEGGRVAQLSRVASGTIQRDDPIEVDLIGPRPEYRNPRNGAVHRPGENAATSVLTGIEATVSGTTVFHWFNFSRGQQGSGSVDDWEFFQAVGQAFSPSTGDFAAMASQMSPEEWQKLGSDPTSELMRRFEAKQLDLSDDAFLAIYKGMIFAEATRSLDENEGQIDALLSAPDRIGQIRNFAADLLEASRVRDTLEAEQSALQEKLDAAQATAAEDDVAYAQNDPSSPERGRVWRGVSEARRNLVPVEKAHELWMSSFPLLARLQTSEITPGAVESRLVGIKTSIGVAREQIEKALMGRGAIDLWHLEAARGRVGEQLGEKGKAVVADEDTSRNRWSWISMGAAVAGGIAIFFLPGGVFLNTAIGAAIAAKSWEEARVIGEMANTGLHPDEGLMSRLDAANAEDAAVLATILALLPVALKGAQVLSGGRMLLSVRAVSPELDLTAQMRLARTLARTPELAAGSGSIAEIDAVLAQRAITLPARELDALRAVVFRLQGRALEASSLTSLREFLRRVWQRKDRMQSRANIYDEYSAATERNPLDATRAKTYDADVAGVHKGRPQGSHFIPQPGKGGADVFYHFYRAGSDPAKATQRIYLTLEANSAPDVMKRVVSEMVDNPKDFPGVVGAKVASSVRIAGRSDSIILYVENEAEVARALSRIREIQAASPKSFMTATPPMTSPVFRGVAVAEEPFQMGERMSFGQSRSDAIYQALRESVKNGENEEQFIQRVLDKMGTSGINPHAPHLNLPPPDP